MLISLLYKQDIVDFDSEVNRFTVSIMESLICVMLMDFKLNKHINNRFVDISETFKMHDN